LKANAQKVVMSRSNSPGIVTQTELCQILKNPDTRTQFIDAIGVPYLIFGDEFIAFDDEKSMQIKAVWISMQNFGGIALHALEMDNMVFIDQRFFMSGCLLDFQRLLGRGMSGGKCLPPPQGHRQSSGNPSQTSEL
jgi:hypothetical protein